LNFFLERGDLVSQGFELSSGGFESVFVENEGSSVLIKSVTELLSKINDALLKGSRFFFGSSKLSFESGNLLAKFRNLPLLVNDEGVSYRNVALHGLKCVLYSDESGDGDESVNSRELVKVITGAHSQVVIGRVGGAPIVAASAGAHKIGTGVLAMGTLRTFGNNRCNFLLVPVGVVATIGKGGSVDPLKG